MTIPEIKTDNTTETEQSKVEVLAKAFHYFRRASKSNSKQLREYLQSRNFDFLKLEIGYNSGQFHHRKSEELIKIYEKHNLLIPSNSPSKTGLSFIPFAKHCIIFPLKDKQNQVISLYGRSIYDYKSSRHFYLKDSQGLYPGYPPVNAKKLIIPKSITDTATLLQIKAGKEKLKDFELLSAYGTNMLTEEHTEAIKQIKSLEEIIIFFGGNQTGRKSAEKYVDLLKTLFPKIQISMVNTPDDEDINSLSVKYDEDCIQTLINERTTLYSPLQPVAISVAQLTNAPKFNSSNHEALTYETNELHITVLGGIKISGLERMKVTLKIKVKNTHYEPLRQHLDLYSNEQLTRLIRTLNEQLNVKTETIRQTLHSLIEELEHYRITRINLLQPLQPEMQEVSLKDITQAETYLKSTSLMADTMKDLGKTGIVGEEYNRIIMYLVFLSRITQEPLHIISFGASGTGKTHLQEKIGALLPEHQKLEITTLSTNALYYFKHDEIRHKVLLIEDMDGAQDVLYPLRELQTKQKITKTVSIKDSQSNIKTLTFTVNGPVCIAGCTVKSHIYEDNANRSILIYIDSSKEQDERIMAYQRDESAGRINKAEEEKYMRLLRTVQSILKPVTVVNPYAPHLKIPYNVFKKRRSNWLYLRFIEVITLYHQYQREQKTNEDTKETYIETTLEDIAWANKLLKGILLRKADELTEPSRNFFENLKAWLKDKNIEQFKTRDIRENLQVTASCLKRYLPELISCGHIKITAGNKTKGYAYEITSYEEYEKLKHSIDYMLDSLLDKLRKESRKEYVKE